MNSARRIDKIKFIGKFKARERRSHIACAVYYSANATLGQRADKLLSVFVKGFAVIMRMTVKDIIHGLSDLASCGNAVNENDLNIVLARICGKNHSAAFNSAENGGFEV